MYKGVSLFLSLCLALSVLTAALPSRVLAAGLTTFDLTLNYTDSTVNNGVVKDDYNKTTATTANVEMDDMMTRQVTPNPDSETPNATIKMEHWQYASRNLDIASLKAISFYCYYTGDSSLGKAQLTVLRGSTNAMTASVTVSSRQNVKKGEWVWIEFDLSTALQDKLVEGTVLSQFWFLPYGTKTPAVLTTDDIVYIAKVRLSSSELDPLPPEEPDPVVNYTVRFRPGRPDVTGNNPQADASYAPGATFKMPRNTYSRSGYSFSHFICTVDTNTYNASTSSWYNNGSTFTVPDNKTGSGRAGADQVIYFIPVFKKNATTLTGLSEVLTANYSDYHNSTSSGVTATKNVDFDGRKTLRVTPNTSSASTEKLSLAGWSWNALPWNMDYYKYVTVEYYFDTTNNNLSTFKPQLRLLTVGGALWDIQIVPSNETVVANRWALLTYDLSNVQLNSNVAAGNHVLNQMHYWWQPDGGTPSQFAAGSNLYIGKISLYHTKPSGTPQLVEKYMDGDTNGNFRPHDRLTKAEAAKILYNILKNYSLTPLPNDPTTAFSDVSASDWFFTSVATLERIGIIPKAAAFSPTAPITKRDFAIYVQNLFHKIGGSETFAGVTLAGGDTITREEAVSILNRLVFGELCWELPEPLGSARVTKFADVHPSVWSYNDIVAATSPRVSLFANGVEAPITLLTDTLDPLNDPEAYDTAAGDAKILEIDAQTAARVAAIRATANTIDPASVTTGTVYYVSSSSGSTSNPGTSADAPYLITTLSAVNSKVGNTTLKSGDIVLFKRGDTFRGQLTTLSGVTYSAYGTGDKPVFIRNTEADAANPANWTLDYENAATGAKIWKYTKNITEAGAVDLIGSDGSIVVAYKEIPSYKSGWWVRGKTNSVAFDYKVELDRDLEFVHLDLPNGSSGNCVPQTGPLYLRCDAGNPGSVYSRIEFNMRGNTITAKSDVTIDNICLLFFGSHGIGAGTAKNLTVTNCELGWGGGATFYYQMSNAGLISRYGNGIEIYGGLKNYTIENCYVYQIYDAGITHQISSTSAGNYIMDNVVYRNNVLEYSTYNIEYFMSLDTASTTVERYMKDVAVTGNILRKAGYGWGCQRPDSEPANIKGWTGQYMPNKAINYTITNNIIDRTYNRQKGNGINDWLAQLYCDYIGCEPYLSGNTFLQVPGRLFLALAQSTYKYNSAAPAAVSDVGVINSTFYYCSEGMEEAKLDTVYRGVMP